MSHDCMSCEAAMPCSHSKRCTLRLPCLGHAANCRTKQSTHLHANVPMVPAFVRKFLVSSVRARPTSAILQVPSRVSRTAGRGQGAVGRGGISIWTALAQRQHWGGSSTAVHASATFELQSCIPLELFISKCTVLWACCRETSDAQPWRLGQQQHAATQGMHHTQTSLSVNLAHDHMTPPTLYPQRTR